MAPDISILCSLCFIFVQVFLSNAVNSEFQVSHANETDHTVNLGRLKRSPSDRLPRHLKIKIQYATGEVIDLEWTMVNQYLVNEHLMVLKASSDSNQNVMEDIGEFVLYHDVKKCSAVVYFEKMKVLYGVIGMNYYIVSLPFDFDENGEHNLRIVGEPYIQKHQDLPIHVHPDNILSPLSDIDAWKNFLSPSHFDLDHPLKHKLDCDSDPVAKQKRTEQHYDGRINEQEVDTNQYNTIRKRRWVPRYQEYYLEILVFVTRDIVELFENYFGEHDIEWIVRYYIVYFNAVDMIFKQLQTSRGQININIAKIVIEDDLAPFDFIARDGEFQFSEIVAKLPEYLNTYSDVYSPDSFDHIFIHTSRTIMDDIIAVQGLTKHGDDLYEARKTNQFNEVVPITMVTYQYNFADYGVAVHEIGRIFNMKIDSREKGLNSMGQCYGIMQIGGPKCDNCLKWSDESLTQLETFLSSNRNRCFLLNVPRSLDPLAVKKLLTPNQQCRCFGYHSYIGYRSGCRGREVGASRCEDPMRCLKTDDPKSDIEITVRPFDGTPCTQKKVCWDGVCTKVSEI